MDVDDSLMNGLVGGVVAVVLSPLTFSPVVGGAVAGYLEGDDGLRVGAIAGVIAAIPLVLVSSLVGGLSILPLVGLDHLGGVVPAALGIVGALLGGFLGVYLEGELAG